MLFLHILFSMERNKTVRGWRPHISVKFPVIVDTGKGYSPHIVLCGENLLMWGGKSYTMWGNGATRVSAFIDENMF